MKKKKLLESTKRKLAIAGLVLVLAIIIVLQKIYYLAHDPIVAKDCPPITPEQPDPSVSAATDTRSGPDISLPWSQRGGTVNDASCLDRTEVYGVVQVKKPEDVKEAIAFAKSRNLKVSIAGVKHSMGGQAFAKNGVVLDMRQFNQVVLNEKARTITVQAGATWHDIQNFLHPKYAVKAMQSTDIFTVGGSISVNAHGMDHNIGSLSNTVRSMRVMMADGTIEVVSPTQNRDLYRHVLGGYGLFGVVLDATIDITENAVYHRQYSIIDYKQFPDIFTKELSNPDNKYGLFYGHLSTAPSSFLKEMQLYKYQTTSEKDAEIPPLGDVANIGLLRFILNFAKYGSLQKELKWYVETRVAPKMDPCDVVSRNQAMKEGEACLVDRNEPMHDSVKYLMNDHKDETDILQEYYIPRRTFVSFVDGMRDVLTKDEANIMNASVRVVNREDIALTYAPTDMFSVVLYVNQSTDEAGNAKMQKLTQDMIDLTTKYGGRFFLPYQIHYTVDQLERSYPEIRAFYDSKRQYDPNETFTSTMYEKHKVMLASVKAQR